ncbi:MAG: helix-turn-helix domain-containing protein [Streptococcus infantarius]|nr:helix-turn-helix domain-containing protein [Streptococcus infantarius]
MEKFGKIFKLIRESKKLSLKEVAGDYVSPAQLSRFENGKSNLSVDTFFYCLKQMNTSGGEFTTLYDVYYQSEDISFSKELHKAVELHNIDFLNHQVEVYTKQYQDTNNSSDRLMIAILHTFMQRCDNSYVIPESDKIFIADYLLSIDDWGIYELWIFGNCARVLSSKSLEILGMEIVNRTQFYNNIAENRKRVYQVLLNVVGHLLDRQEERSSIKFLKVLDGMDILETDLLERLLLKFSKAHLSYLQGKKDGLEVMKECKKIATQLECYDLSKQIETTISQLTDM